MWIGPAASLAEQLKQVLAERERRLTSDGRAPESRVVEGRSEGRSQPDPVRLTDELVDEIRQAVSEANARGRCLPAMYSCYSASERPAIILSNLSGCVQRQESSYAERDMTFSGKWTVLCKKEAHYVENLQILFPLSLVTLCLEKTFRNRISKRKMR